MSDTSAEADYMTDEQIKEVRAEGERAKARRRMRHEKNKATAAEEARQAGRTALKKQSDQEAISHGLDAM